MKSGKHAGMVLVAILVGILSTAAQAEPWGKIAGKVTEKGSGDPIAGAIVTIIETGQAAQTTKNGSFVIAGVKEGSCTIRFMATGYAPQEIGPVSVLAGQTTTVNVELARLIEELGKTLKAPADRSLVDKVEISRESKKGQGSYYMNEPDLSVQRIVRTPYPQPQPPSYPPAHGGSAIVNGQPYDAMFFKDYGTNPFIDTEDDHLSTFAIDVDDASYILARSYLERGELPPDEAIRTEEFINHFNYDYESPEWGPFSVHVEGGPAPFGQNAHLLKIGIKGREIESEERKAANLVFVIDVSGSMAREDRLELVKRALRMLVDNLEPFDQVGIVVYGTRGRVLLEPTSIRNRYDILAAIDWLHPEGSTNAEEGLRLGYRMAERNFERGKINRVILCSDGVANVGVTKAEELLKWIKGYADRGITLTTVGFGMGNYNDVLMEQLGDKGNGNYAYVDGIEEAKRIFLEKLTGTLQVIAKDVKIQVDFNPETVQSYRLLGYENRDVADNKFRDNREDGGEIGAGHQVTALYEVKFRKAVKSSQIATVFVRSKHPETNRADEVAFKVTRRDFRVNLNSCSPDFKLAAAAAEFAEILGKSYWAKGSHLAQVRQLARQAYRGRDNSDVAEFMNLIDRAERLERELAGRDIEDD